MKILALRARAFIEGSIQDFGTPEQQAIWSEWAAAHPEVRTTSADPEDDGNGPMPELIQRVIVDTLHKRFDYLMHQIRSPVITANEAANLSSEVGTVYAIAKSLNSGLAW
jgi:hypothetical protein